MTHTAVQAKADPPNRLKLGVHLAAAPSTTPTPRPQQRRPEPLHLPDRQPRLLQVHVHAPPVALDVLERVPDRLRGRALELGAVQGGDPAVVLDAGERDVVPLVRSDVVRDDLGVRGAQDGEEEGGQDALRWGWGVGFGGWCGGVYRRGCGGLGLGCERAVEGA